MTGNGQRETVVVDILSGPQRNQSVSVRGPRFLIGREDDCHLQLAGGRISRHHCVLLLDGYTVRVRDLGSRNGTQVNSRPLRGECIVMDGDHIRVADVLLRIRFSGSAAANEPEAVARADDEARHDTTVVPPSVNISRTGKIEKC